MKGEGGAAHLLELCDPSELPTTIVTFLDDIYSRFPRPTPRVAPPPAAKPQTSAATGIDQQPRVSPPESPTGADDSST